MPRQSNVKIDENTEYEIKGLSYPRFRLRPLRFQAQQINLEIPNGELNFGKRFFNMTCAQCHQLADSDTTLGPALRNVYMRKIGKRKNYPFYSEEMNASEGIWTKQKLWEFLENPEGMFSNTAMAFEGVGIKQEQQYIDLRSSHISQCY